MSGMLRVHNWDKWQSYRKDRQPPWLKIHRSLIREPKWLSLSDSERGHLISIWILAADENGAIPNDPKLIRKLCYLDAEPNLNRLIELGFLDNVIERKRASRVASPPKQVPLEERRGEERRGEERRGESGAIAPVEETPLSILKTILDDPHAEAVIEFRAKNKQSNSPLAIRRLANQLAKFERPNDGAAEMICRGWKGFDPDWMRGKGTGPPPKEAHFNATVERLISEVDQREQQQIGQRKLCDARGINGSGELHAATSEHGSDAEIVDEDAGGAPRRRFGTIG